MRASSRPAVLGTALLSLWVVLAFVLWPRTPVVERSDCVPIERVLWCSHVVTAQFGTVPGFVRIDRRGKLSAVHPGSMADAEAYAHANSLPVELHREMTLSPGVVDLKVQLASLRRSWEGYAFGTRAAVAGGVTTLIDGPYGSDPAAIGKHELQLHMRAAATDVLSAHVGFSAGLTPAVARDPLAIFSLATAGALAFQAVMSPVHEEVHAEPLNADALVAAAEPISRTQLPLIVRAELGQEEDLRAKQTQAVFEYEADRDDHVTHFRTRPPEWQAAGLAAIAEALQAVSGVRVHASSVAVADEETSAALTRAREAGGARFTADTSPHYLVLEAFAIRPGDTRCKAEPAVRDEENRARLWTLLGRGIVDMVTSDHAPCPPDLRAEGDFLTSWAGIAGLQFALQATWTEARKRGHSVGTLAKWLSERPARLMGLEGRKGEIRIGADADLVLWDPAAVVRPPHAEFHRQKASPFANVTLHGRIEETIVAGVPAFAHGHHTHNFCGSVLLSRSAHTAGATWTATSG
mmetsp:Transcript_14270/g.38454  ORF Transcript_14270/g.38454 Transcript_14270/m.38454 type:complete len:522 (+) Transcript_14270:123-1688(+)